MKDDEAIQLSKDKTRLRFLSIDDEPYTIPVKDLTTRTEIVSLNAADPDTKLKHWFYWGSKGKVEVSGTTLMEVETLLMGDG